jgi:hypothetical protein
LIKKNRLVDLKNFFSLDRKLIIISLLVGFIILLISQILLTYENYLISMLGCIILALTYFLLPLQIFKNREVTFNGKIYLNKDMQNISKILPTNIINQIILLIMFSAICMMIINYAIKFEDIINMIGSNNIKFFKNLSYIIIPYLIIHIYFFAKNLPMNCYIIYFIGENGAYGFLREYFDK